MIQQGGRLATSNPVGPTTEASPIKGGAQTASVPLAVPKPSPALVIPEYRAP